MGIQVVRLCPQLPLSSSTQTVGEFINDAVRPNDGRHGPHPDHWELTPPYG